MHKRYLLAFIHRQWNATTQRSTTSNAEQCSRCLSWCCWKGLLWTEPDPRWLAPRLSLAVGTAVASTNARPIAQPAAAERQQLGREGGKEGLSLMLCSKVCAWMVNLWFHSPINQIRCPYKSCSSGRKQKGRSCMEQGTGPFFFSVAAAHQWHSVLCWVRPSPSAKLIPTTPSSRGQIVTVEAPPPLHFSSFLSSGYNSNSLWRSCAN